MLPFQKILVAAACGEADHDLMAYAAMLGRTGSSEFSIVHVLAADGALPADRARAILAGWKPVFGAAAERTRFSVLEGERLDALLRFVASDRPDVILLGHRRARSGRRSLARRLAMSAPCSVWLVPEGSPVGIRRVLAPVDFSTRSAGVLRVATRIAAAAALDECYALHVRFNEAYATFDEYESIEVAGEEDAFGLFVARLDLNGVDVKAVFEESPNIADTILRVAREKGCDLIVMGTRGRSRAASILLGSETEQTFIHTSVPVLAVKDHGSQLRLLQALLEQRIRDRGRLRFT
jgi:nucleotide-binding universal stress UspA family protein